MARGAGCIPYGLLESSIFWLRTVYSPKSIERAIRAIEQSWAKQALEPEQQGEVRLPPVPLEYHSVSECRQFVDHCDQKLKDAVWTWGEDKADEHVVFDRLELLWIRNERALCQADYSYYAQRYPVIMGEEKLISYSPQLSQQIFNHYRSIIEDLGWAIMMQVLKARQVGITTDCQVAISHRTCFFPDVIAMTGSADKDKTLEMVDKYRLIYEGLPYWLKPGITRDRQGAVLKFGDLNSRLVIQHGRMETGIGRGNTPVCVHLSEICEYPDPATLIDAGLLPAIHENPRILFALESTAAGPHDWWYKKWHWNKANYWQGRAKLCPIFLPWFTRPDIYPTQGWLLQHGRDIETWIPDVKTLGHAKRAEVYVRSDEHFRKFYPENWKMPREQMLFWEITRAEYKAAGKLDIFQREFAGDDEEAFTASGESVFDIEITTAYRERCNDPVGFFAFRSENAIIPERFHPQPHEVDRSKRSLRVGPYELVPCLWKGWDSTEIFDRLLILEWPEEGAVYGFGVQTGFGIGKERSVVEGIRQFPGGFSARQVCELASPYINAQDLAPMAHCIALLYQEAMGKQPRVAVDSTKNGELTQHVLKQLGWGHFHSWVRYDRKKIEPEKSNRLGWYTNIWSRPMLMDMMTWALRGEMLDIRSREFVREMQSLHADEDMQEARAEYGAFDDRFMALAIIYFSLNILQFGGKHVDTSFLRIKTGGQKTVLYTPDSLQTVAPPLDANRENLGGAYSPNQNNTLLLDSHYAVHNSGGNYSWEEEV